MNHRDARTLELPKMAALLKNGPFLRLWAAQFSAVTVVYSLSLAGAVLVEERTHSSTQTGLVILSAILPAFLASLISGAVVDRWGRKRVLLASHMARTLVAMAFWAGTGLLSPSLALVTVYAVNVAGAAFSQFATPAELALLPDLVDRTRLLSANALFQLSMLTAEGLGIVILSPLLIKRFGVPVVGLVGMGLFFVAVILVANLPRDPVPAGKLTKESLLWSNVRSDLNAGWSTISRDRLLRLVAIQATLAATLLLVLLSLMPGLMSRHLGLGVEDAPLLILPGGLGFVLGALLLNRWEHRFSRPVWIAVGLGGLGISITLLSALGGSPRHLWIILPLIVGMGIALAMVIVSARVVLQEHPPAAMRGRVIAAQLAMANAAAVIPLLLGGSLADHLGVRPVMALLGLLAVGAGAIGLYQARTWSG
jgi:DHA3 family macrolide efflux protein-like MFS transporter